MNEKAKTTNNGSFLKLFKTLTARVLSSLKILWLRPWIFKLDKTLLWVFQTLHKSIVSIQQAVKTMISIRHVCGETLHDGSAFHSQFLVSISQANFNIHGFEFLCLNQHRGIAKHKACELLQNIVSRWQSRRSVKSWENGKGLSFCF